MYCRRILPPLISFSNHQVNGRAETDVLGGFSWDLAVESRLLSAPYCSASLLCSCLHVPCFHLEVQLWSNWRQARTEIWNDPTLSLISQDLRLTKQLVPLIGFHTLPTPECLEWLHQLHPVRTSTNPLIAATLSNHPNVLKRNQACSKLCWCYRGNSQSSLYFLSQACHQVSLSMRYARGI